MSERPLLLEIGLEEMPARFINDAVQQLSDKITSLLTTEKIPFHGVHTYSTPRRLAIYIEKVLDKQEDVVEEIKGPAKKVALDEEGNWTKAAEGFTKSQGKTVDDIYFKEVNGSEYCFVKKMMQGNPTISILPKLAGVVESLTFPKNMRWSNLDIRYIRPIRWLLAKYGEETIDFAVANVNSGNFTFGHRFLGKKIEINDPSTYSSLLAQQYVIVDYHQRKEMIKNQLQTLEKEKGWVIPIDPELLDEVTNLVEYPTILYGSFDEKYLQLPDQVLITTMKEHQRYFPVTDQKGNLLPYFVTVRNGDQHNLDLVRRGNEKVLRARLQDAVFFYEEDQKLTIDEALTRLDNVVYHDEIGTYSDKISRVVQLTQYLLDQLSLSEEEKCNALRAARICKFDLVTQMVNEFPELQGFMGEKYALLFKEEPMVAVAINEHYMPRNAEDELPKTNIGALLSIADKLETITAFFSINIIPSGSQDPYGLRRQATGIVEILADKGWGINFSELLKESIRISQSFAKRSDQEIFDDLIAFFKLRLKHLLQEKNIRYDIIDAVLAAPIKDIKSLITKAELINKKKDESRFKEDIESLSRVIRIAKKLNEPHPIDPNLFENEYERKLYEQFLLGKKAIQNADVEKYYALLVQFKPFITDYFDHTMIMVEDERIRNNRLSLMKQIADMILQFAHVHEIIVK